MPCVFLEKMLGILHNINSMQNKNTNDLYNNRNLRLKIFSEILTIQKQIIRKFTRTAVLASMK